MVRKIGTAISIKDSRGIPREEDGKLIKRSPRRPRERRSRC